MDDTRHMNVGDIIEESTINLLHSVITNQQRQQHHHCHEEQHESFKYCIPRIDKYPSALIFFCDYNQGETC